MRCSLELQLKIAAQVCTQPSTIGLHAALQQGVQRDLRASLTTAYVAWRLRSLMPSREQHQQEQLRAMLLAAEDAAREQQAEATRHLAAQVARAP